jgi:hypothetical protein
LAFEGQQIAAASSEHLRSDGAATRWHELALYAIKSTTYVLAIGYRTRWRGELDNDQIFGFESISEARDFLRNHDPCEGVTRVRGQDGPGLLRRGEIRRMAELSERYDAAVSELLAQFPEVLR